VFSELEAWLRSKLQSGHMVLVPMIQLIFTTPPMVPIQLGNWLDHVLPVAADFVHFQSSTSFLMTLPSKQYVSNFDISAVRFHALEAIGMMSMILSSLLTNLKVLPL